MKAPTNQRDRTRSDRLQRGATLIEILVAVLILSLGLLSMAALQTRALKGNQSSVQRSQAVMLANYMMDAMRVDREGAKAGSYNTGGAFQCSAAAYGGATLPDRNRNHWLASVQTNLGVASDAKACGFIACTADYLCTVRVRWDDRRGENKDLEYEQTLEIRSRV